MTMTSILYELTKWAIDLIFNLISLTKNFTPLTNNLLIP